MVKALQQLAEYLRHRLRWRRGARRPNSSPRHAQHLVWGFVLLALLGLGGGVLWYGHERQPRTGGERPLEQLGHFGTVPEFTLVERSERRITLTDLHGLVWVGNFFYTNCPDTCPLQSATMARSQQDFANDRDVRLVSISVDPAHDTPAVLRDYAQRFGADPVRWLFLTGDKAAIYRLAQDGFHLSVVDPGTTPSQPPAAPPVGVPSGARSQRRFTPQDARSPLRWPFRALGYEVLVPRWAWAHAEVEHPMFLHSARFVLVDRQARLRGYYHSDEEAALQRLRRDVRTVLRE